MAALTISGANVGVGEQVSARTSQEVRTRLVRAGEALDAGELVYLSSTTDKYHLALNTGTIEQARVAGITLTKAPANGWVVIQENGIVLIGTAAGDASETFVLGSTPGTIEPIGDLSAAEKLTYIGFGPNDDSIDLNITPTGTVVS